MAVNIILLPLVVTAVLLSILGVYNISSDAEYDIAQVSIDSITHTTKKGNEILHAVIDGHTLNITNYGMQQSKVFMMDFRIINDTDVNRVIYSDDHYFDNDTPVHEIRKRSFDAPVVDAGSVTVVPVNDFDISPFTVQSASITTDSGNRFLVDVLDVQNRNTIDSDGNSDDDDDDGEDGKAMINGLGLQARIIQLEFDEARITFGSGVTGTDVSMRPYIPVDSDTNFAALIESSNTPEVYPIPAFWHEYLIGPSNTLIDSTIPPPNILGYTHHRVLSGNAQVSNTNSNTGITITGNGHILLHLNNYEDQRLILRGDTQTGTAKIITSDTPLMTASYTAHGYQMYATGTDPGPSSFRIPVGTDSVHTGIFTYDQRYLFRHDHHCHCSTHIHPNEIRHIEVQPYLVTQDHGDHKVITGDNTDPRDVEASYRVTPLGTQNYFFELYDTLPAYDRVVLEGAFEQDHVFPAEPVYLSVRPNGDTVTIKAETSQDVPFLKIANVQANIPYQIIKDGYPIATGMSDDTGQILIEHIDNTSSLVGGLLYLYPDALTYRGAFSTVLFDSIHKKTIHVSTSDYKVYVIHTYAHIPVTGTVTITDLNLDGTLDLPYLNGVYNNNDQLDVPIVPGFKQINLRINGVETSLKYANILGNTGITIADPATSHITQNSISSAIRSAQATAGTTAFAIATSDGVLKAVISETISGVITITNTYQLEHVPPPPPPIPRRDPLTAEVDIFVNGQFIERKTLGINPYPDFSYQNTRQGNQVIQSVTYSYPAYTLSGTASVDVRAGDFIEFHVYGKIYGAIPIYTPPPNYIVTSSSGVSSATANIKSAHINTAM